MALKRFKLDFNFFPDLIRISSCGHLFIVTVDDYLLNRSKLKIDELINQYLNKLDNEIVLGINEDFQAVHNKSKSFQVK